MDRRSERGRFVRIRRRPSTKGREAQTTKGTLCAGERQPRRHESTKDRVRCLCGRVVVAVLCRGARRVAPARRRQRRVGPRRLRVGAHWVHSDSERA